MDLVTSSYEFNNLVLKSMSSAILQRLQKQSAVLKLEIQKLIRSTLNNDQCISSLLGYDIAISNLQRQFGLTDDEAVDAVDKIISAVIDSIEISINTTAGKKTSNIVCTLSVLPESLQRSMGQSIGVYTSGPSGSPIPWLDWLLTRGLEIVVFDYRLFLTDSDKSRAGGAIMAKQSGSFYRVDSRFAGTVGDNFLTRAIYSTQDEITKIISRLLE